MASMNLEMEQLDAKILFPYSGLEEEIYLEQSEGFKAKGKEDMFCKLKKNLYGLKQTLHKWVGDPSSCSPHPLLYLTFLSVLTWDLAASGSRTLMKRSKILTHLCRFCSDLRRSFSSLFSAQLMAGSVLELLVHIGHLLRPGESNEDVEILLDWMLENPPEQEEEMAGAAYDFDHAEGVDLSHGEYGGMPASRSVIEGLQRSPYGRGDGVREEECVICLEKFDARAEVSKIPCSHAFHSRCIIQWLEVSNLCPICRSQMPTASSN
ncbi:uncharacterized protein [Elaeis guineensis]|uniref:uncharacterized protein n=1 Tax=Elaeis guineensis var. tenera TaxID=51953 RepID=UPI003C6D35D3